MQRLGCPLTQKETQSSAGFSEPLPLSARETEAEKQGQRENVLRDRKKEKGSQSVAREEKEWEHSSLASLWVFTA